MSKKAFHNIGRKNSAQIKKVAVRKLIDVNPANLIIELTKDERAFLHYLVTVAAEHPNTFGGDAVRLDTGAKRLYLAMVTRLSGKLS
jgi:hypothetical protein